MEEVLAKEKAIYDEMAEKHCEPQFQKLKQSQETWKNIKDDIIKVIENNLSNGKSCFQYHSWKVYSYI